MARGTPRAPGGSKLPMFEPRNSTSVGPVGRGAAAARRSPLRRCVDGRRRAGAAAAPRVRAASVERRGGHVDEVRRRAAAGPRAPSSISVASFSPLPRPELDDRRRRSRRRGASTSAACSRAAAARRASRGTRAAGRSPRTGASRAHRRSPATAAAAAAATGSSCTSAANCASACLTFLRSSSRAFFVLHASEARVHVWVMAPEPVAERRPQQLTRGDRRRTFITMCSPSKKSAEYSRIRRHRAEAGEWCKRRARPLPAVPDEVLDAPGARSRRMRAGQFRDPNC